MPRSTRIAAIVELRGSGLSAKSGQRVNQTVLPTPAAPTSSRRATRGCRIGRWRQIVRRVKQRDLQVPWIRLRFPVPPAAHGLYFVALLFEHRPRKHAG